VSFDLVALAFDPTCKIIGGACSKVFDRFDAVLAKRYQHCRGHVWHILERIIDAKLFAFGLKFQSHLCEIDFYLQAGVGGRSGCRS